MKLKLRIISALLVYLFFSKASAFELKGNIALLSGAGFTKINDIKLDAKQIPDKSFISSFIDVGIGYDLLNIFNSHIRAEVNYIDYYKKKDDLKLNKSVFMLNGFYDFVGYSDTLDKLGITPYIGAGIGFNDFSFKKIEQIFTGKSDKNSILLAYNISAGINFYLNDTFSATLGYKYINSGKSSIEYKGSKASANVSHHQFMLGIKYHFTLR